MHKESSMTFVKSLWICFMRVLESRRDGFNINWLYYYLFLQSNAFSHTSRVWIFIYSPGLFVPCCFKTSQLLMPVAERTQPMLWLVGTSGAWIPYLLVWYGTLHVQNRPCLDVPYWTAEQTWLISNHFGVEHGPIGIVSFLEFMIRKVRKNVFL